MLSSLPRSAAEALLYDWSVWGRADQVWRPGEETHTIYLAGRGWGKTRTGAEAARYVAEHPELCGGRMLIAGRTAADVRETMVEGISGIMAISPPSFRPVYQPSRARLVWPNGVVALLRSGEKPESFRGLNTGWAWLDELAHWAHAGDAFAQIAFGLRIGDRPRSVITTTPLGTPELIRLVYKTDPTGQPVAGANGPLYNPQARIVRGSTFDNRANLAGAFLDKIVADYEGTRLGAQELYGEILMSVEGAIWSAEWWRRCELEDVPELRRVIVVVDPAVSVHDKSDETGIVAAGLGVDGKVYLLADASGRYSPAAWAEQALRLATLHGASEICVEDNQGGDLVEFALREVQSRARSRFRVERVRATKSKAHRWSMAALAWERGGVIHCGSPRGWVKTEHQLLQMTDLGAGSADLLDRGDAACWAVLRLAGARSDARAPRALANASAWAEIAKRLR